ncbi:MAG: DUF1987 domain-containing protein [Bacteroidetes bacterium]|nr:DUF1987 domain-containing protein [Bacteroidota bacterium]MBU1718830.1 DUF1987 domain-containing protein [Bacteroidota bacterium]
MEKLVINATENTPEVIFDPASGNFEISGESRPENVREFYEPILNWLNEFSSSVKSDQGTLTFKFKFEYFNSSSAKFILDVLKKISEIHSKGADFKIIWYYDDGDEDMQEAGEEMSKMVKLPFSYIEVLE